VGQLFVLISIAKFPALISCKSFILIVSIIDQTANWSIDMADVNNSPDSVKVLLADDHELVRSGMRSMLEALGTYKVVAESENGSDTLKAVKEFMPDLLILDIQMPGLGGLEVLKRLQSDDSKVQVLIVSASEPGLSVSEAFNNGAAGYLTKNASREEFCSALTTIRSGKKYVSPSIAEYAVSNSKNSSPIAGLSEREREVFKLLAEGRKNKEIAKMLFVSSRTIDTHRLNIMKKLDVKTNGELVQMAMRYGVM
jgi:DNA-binding NarL/FixJ family response regulator